MTQAELNRAVAASTGEAVELISRQGFGYMEMPDREPMVYDWDDQDARMLGATFD